MHDKKKPVQNNVGAKRGPRNASDRTVERIVARRLLNPLPVIERTVPTVAPSPETKGIPYHMAAMNGPDPLRMRKIAQMLEGARGKV